MKLFLYGGGKVLADRLMATADIDLSEFKDLKYRGEYDVDFTLRHAEDIYEEVGKGYITIRLATTCGTPNIKGSASKMLNEKSNQLYANLTQRELKTSKM